MSISTALFVPDASAELSACKPDPNGFALHPDDLRRVYTLISGFGIAMSLLRSMPILKAADERTTFGPRSGLECLPFSKPKDGSTPKISGMKVIA